MKNKEALLKEIFGKSYDLIVFMDHYSVVAKLKDYLIKNNYSIVMNINVMNKEVISYSCEIYQEPMIDRKYFEAETEEQAMVLACGYIFKKNKKKKK